MDGFELYELGRKLMQIGEEAIADPSGSRRLAPGALTVMADVFEHPDTSVSEIVARTGFPVNEVTVFLTALRDLAAVTTAVDPDLPGRTVVRPIPRHSWAPRADELLAAAAGIQEPGQVKDVIGTLDELARRLAGTLSPDLFDWYTAETPAWDVGHPQPAIRELAERGDFRGRVLEVGCGTGEIAMMAAALGLPAVGIDPASTAIETARRKARERGLPVEFLIGNAFELGKLGDQFDTVVDCGLFHVFSDPERVRYANNLATVMPPGARLFLLCFSDRHPPGRGPRRVSRREIRSSFGSGWRVDTIEAATLENNQIADGVPAWLATITRI